MSDMPGDLLASLPSGLLQSVLRILLAFVATCSTSLSGRAFVGSPRSDGERETSGHDDRLHRQN